MSAEGTATCSGCGFGLWDRSDHPPAGTALPGGGGLRHQRGPAGGSQNCGSVPELNLQVGASHCPLNTKNDDSISDVCWGGVDFLSAQRWCRWEGGWVSSSGEVQLGVIRMATEVGNLYRRYNQEEVFRWSGEGDQRRTTWGHRGQLDESRVNEWMNDEDLEVVFALLDGRLLHHQGGKSRGPSASWWIRRPADSRHGGPLVWSAQVPGWSRPSSKTRRLHGSGGL